MNPNAFSFSDEPFSVSADVALRPFGVTLLFTRAKDNVEAWEAWGVEIDGKKMREQSPTNDSDPADLLPAGPMRAVLIAAEQEWRDGMGE